MYVDQFDLDYFLFKLSWINFFGLKIFLIKIKLNEKMFDPSLTEKNGLDHSLINFLCTSILVWIPIRKPLSALTKLDPAAL